MNNIKTGADMMAGDGGYSIGTKEGHDEFTSARNKALFESKIKEFAVQAKLQMVSEPRLQEFAELIIRECVGIVEFLPPGYQDYRDQIEDAFRKDCIETIFYRFGIDKPGYGNNACHP